MSFTISAYYRSDDELILQTVEDVTNFLAYLSTEAEKDADNTAAALYVNERPKAGNGLPDHEIRVGINPQLSAAAFGFTDARGSFYARGTDSGRTEVPYFSEGHDESFPADSVVTLDAIRKALAETLETGQRPTDLVWGSIR